MWMICRQHALKALKISDLWTDTQLGSALSSCCKGNETSILLIGLGAMTCHFGKIPCPARIDPRNRKPGPLKGMKQWRFQPAGGLHDNDFHLGRFQPTDQCAEAGCVVVKSFLDGRWMQKEVEPSLGNVDAGNVAVRENQGCCDVQVPLL